ncbi:unnamed protein product [Orchesella dallaii]|uniref:Uncharacterized protein n=1 Tax=Orchesella dallaii TaxID=48710 RepID=A0ABP1RNP6_9HEXA
MSQPSVALEKTTSHTPLIIDQRKVVEDDDDERLDPEDPELQAKRPKKVNKKEERSCGKNSENQSEEFGEDHGVLDETEEMPQDETDGVNALAAQNEGENDTDVGAMSTRRRARGEDGRSTSKRACQALLERSQHQLQVITGPIQHAVSPINMLDVEKIVELIFSTDHTITRRPANLAKVAFPTKDEARGLFLSMVLYTKEKVPSNAHLLFAASQGTTGGLMNWSYLLRNSPFINAVTRTWPSELQAKANMMARIMRTNQRFVNPGDDKFKLTAVFCFVFSQLYKAKNQVAGFPSKMVEGERIFLFQHPEYAGAGLALPFDHEVFIQTNIQQRDFPSATAIEADERRYSSQVINQKAELATSERSLSAAKAEHAQCKAVLKILDDTLVGGLGSMAKSLAERGCRTYNDFVDIIRTSGDFNFQALQQGLASSLRGEAITTLELPGVASPSGGDRVNHDLYPGLEDHLRDGHFIICGDMNCSLCISARHFPEGIADQQQQGAQQLEDGGGQQHQLENRGEQQQEQEDGGGANHQEQDDGEQPGKGKDMERLIQLHQHEAPGEEEGAQAGEPGNHQDDDADAAGNKEPEDVRPGEPGNHQDDDADAAGNKEADDVRPGEPVNHPDSDDDDDTDSTEEENRVEIQFSPGALEGWVDLA